MYDDIQKHKKPSALGRIKTQYSNGLILGIFTVLMMILEIVFMAFLSFFCPANKIDVAFDFNYFEYYNEPRKNERFGDHDVKFDKMKPKPS